MLLKNERSLKATKNKMSVLYLSLARKGSLGRAREETPFKRNARNFKIIDKYAPEVNLEILNAAARSSAALSRHLFLNYLPPLNCLQDPRQCQADWRRFEFVARSYDSRCKFSNFHSNQKSERNLKMRQFSQVFKFSPQI